MDHSEATTALCNASDSAAAMTREFCDRCGAEVTGERSAAIHGIADADADGNGTQTDNFDVICPRCYREWRAWMKSTSARLTRPDRPPRTRTRALKQGGDD